MTKSFYTHMVEFCGGLTFMKALQTNVR